MKVFCGIIRLDFSPISSEVIETYRSLSPRYATAATGPFLLMGDRSRPADRFSSGALHVCGDLHPLPDGDRDDSWTALSDILRLWKGDRLGDPRLSTEHALAMADEESRTIALVRDRLGMRPLYWSVVGGDLVFGTVASLVARHPAYRFEVDRYGVALAILEADGDLTRTTWDGISRVPSGTVLTWRDGRREPDQRYWDPKTSTVRMTAEDAAAGFREIFGRAIRRRYRAGTTGAFLSGGLDSSSVVCVAAEQGIDLRTYTLRFPDDPDADEAEFVEAVTRKYGLRNTQIEVRNDLETTRWSPGGVKGSPDLFYYPNLQMLGPLFDAAVSEGTTRLIDGLGGDHLLHATAAPLDLIAAAFRSGGVRSAIRVARHWSEIEPLGPTRGIARLLLRRVAPPRLRFLWSKWKRQFPAREVPYRLAITTPVAGDLYPWKRPALTNQTKQATLETMLSRSFFERWFEQNYLLATCHGAEQTSPYADVELLEFVLSVPVEHLFGPERPRLLQREALRGILPEKVRTREDKGAFDGLIDHVLHHRLIPEGTRFIEEHGIEAASLIAGEDAIARWIDAISEGSPGWEIPLFVETLAYEQWFRLSRAGRFFGCAGM
ncbi:MAG: asparagine synthase-related protein [Thermoanaerobaculia bacterium]|nr:asparagine synthase-related protein [Thermoanaerobaculia bacterium]